MPTGRLLRPRSVSLRRRVAREHPPRWRCRRPSRRACMGMSGSVYQCRRKWRLRPLPSRTAAPNARGRFRRHADWRCIELAGAARDSALPPDGGQLADKAVNLVKRQASAALLQPVVMEGESLESVYQFDYLLPIHKRRRRRGGHGPSHGHRGRAVA